MPDEYVASKIAHAFTHYQSIENLRILLMRAEVANPELPRELEQLGAIVDDVASYQTVPETEDRNGAVAKLLEGGADWITFTSSSTAENFHARFNLPELAQRFSQIKLASIGPETSKTIRRLGLEPQVEPREHTIDALVQAIAKATRTRSG
jgi:uroporphyrinogen III methyltransferase/synthase